MSKDNKLTFDRNPTALVESRHRIHQKPVLRKGDYLLRAPKVSTTGSTALDVGIIDTRSVNVLPRLRYATDVEKEDTSPKFVWALKLFKS